MKNKNEKVKDAGNLSAFLCLTVPAWVAVPETVNQQYLPRWGVARCSCWKPDTVQVPILNLHFKNICLKSFVGYQSHFPLTLSSLSFFFSLKQ